MGTFKSIFSVSFCTLLSRILGLLRDILVVSSFGTGALNSAFLIGFTLPNLFRRLLGEGALNSALIPIFSDEYNKEGKDRAFILLNKVASRLILVLSGIIALGIFLLTCGIWTCDIFCNPTSLRWKLCFTFSAVLLPYMFFICLAAVLSAILNVFEKFLLAACNSIWLNLSMIVSVILGYFSPENLRIYILCAGVLCGGTIQMLSLWYGLARCGWRFKFDLKSGDRVEEFQHLFFPGIVGAATLQINTAVSRVLAHSVTENAVSILYLADRLIELPLGVFVIAITTVVFPVLARLSARGEKKLLKQEFERGILLVLMIIFPAMAGLLGLDRTLIELLFLWKNFTTSDVNLVVPVLRISILSLPFYALSIIFTRGYHCKKNMIYPMRLAFINFATNVIFTLGLMFHFKEVGIALANLLSVILQTFLLYSGLTRMYEEFRVAIFSVKILKLFAASAMMGLIVIGMDHLLGLYLDGKMHNIVSVGVNVPLGAALYVVFVYLFLEKNDREDFNLIASKFLKKIGIGKKIG